MNSSLTPNRRFSPLSRRRPALAVACAALLLLAGCGRNTTQALQYEAQADQFIAAGNMVMAAQLLDKALSYDANDSGRWLKLGRARRELGQPQQSLDAFRQAFDLDPNSVEAMQNLAVIYVAARRWEQAQQVADPLLTLNPDDIAGLLTTGAIAYYEEDYTEASRLAERIIKLAPDSKEGYVLKAHVLEKTGHVVEAARLLEARLALTPDDGDMAEQLLGLYRSLGSVAGVRSISLRLAVLKPNDPRYQLESLRAYQARGDTANRERVTEAMVQRYRNNPSILGAIADFWLAALPRDEALERIHAIALPSNTLTRAALAGRMIAFGAGSGAGDLVRPVASLPVASDNVDLQAMLAGLLMSEGDIKGARRQAQRVLDFDETNDVALLIRARVYLADKAYDKALTDAQVVVSDDPGNDGAGVLIARIYAAKGDDALAANAFGQAQSRSPRSVGVVRARTEWLIEKDRAAEAADIAGLFARSVNRPDAWALYEATCKAANDPVCVTLARSRGAV